MRSYFSRACLYRIAIPTPPRVLFLAHSFTKLARRSGEGPGLAWQPRHPRRRGPGVHRAGDTAARRDIEAVRHRGDLPFAVRFLHARRWRAAARPTAAAGDDHRRDVVEHRRSAVAVRVGLRRSRLRQAFARPVPGADATGGDLADDGFAGA